jgi:pimeloyl-CoA synthetase
MLNQKSLHNALHRRPDDAVAGKSKHHPKVVAGPCGKSKRPG